MDGHARLVVRSMQPSDQDFVAELGRSAFGEYSREPGAGVVAMARRGHTLVASQRGELVGFVIVEVPAPEKAHLTAISVSEGARGRGIARALLGAAERVARQAGAPSLGVVTADSNLAALELFLRCGFERVGRLARYYQRGQNAVRMEKCL
jgi:ribosomal protein S18 acetylase RimI-like enzyme